MTKIQLLQSSLSLFPRSKPSPGAPKKALLLVFHSCCSPRFQFAYRKQSDLLEKPDRLCTFLSQNFPKDFAWHWLQNIKTSPYISVMLPLSPTPKLCWAWCSLNTLDTFLPRSLPLLCPLATGPSAKICTDFIILFRSLCKCHLLREDFLDCCIWILTPHLLPSIFLNFLLPDIQLRIYLLIFVSSNGT